MSDDKLNRPDPQGKAKPSAFKERIHGALALAGEIGAFIQQPLSSQRRGQAD